jgi:hypothetical protein
MEQQQMIDIAIWLTVAYVGLGLLTGVAALVMFFVIFKKVWSPMWNDIKRFGS